MTDFNGIDRQFPNPQYPAGVYDGQKSENKGPDSTTYPNLVLPCSLIGSDGSSIPQGYYMAVLSFDKQFIDLYQSNELKARVKVIKLVEKMYTQEELQEEDDILGRLEIAKQKQQLKKIREIEEELEAYRERTAAETYCEIEDSGKGYYILKYNCNGKTATGIIQK